MNDRQKERLFRTHIAGKIADIEDNHCKSCEYVSVMNKFKVHCVDCKHGQELRRYGDLLSDKSKVQRANKSTQKKKQEAEKMTKPLKVKEDYPEINGLTRDKYMMLKDEGKNDAEIRNSFNISKDKLTSMKGKWGVLGYKGNVITSPKAVVVPEEVEPATLQERYDKLLTDFQQLEANYDDIHTKNVDGAKEYQGLLTDHRNLKGAFDELVKQKKELDREIERKDNFIRNLSFENHNLTKRELDSIKKYNAVAAALKLHLPEVGES